MSTDRETTRIVRSWLEEGVTALPDRVLDTVLDRVPATPQRRSWWPPRRFAYMNNLARFGLGAAAVVVAALLAINLWPGLGGPGARPTPTPSAVPTAVPTAPPEASKGPLAAGTYSYSSPDITGTPFTFTVPAGWMLDPDSFIFKGVDWRADGVALGTWKPTHIYPSSCVGPRSPVAVGSKASLVAALGAQTGHTTIGPTVVTLGGLPATRFEFSEPTGFDIASCDSGIVRLWPDPGPDENGGLPMFAGQTTTVWVIDDNGKVTALVTVRNSSAPAADVAELQAVLDSVTFQR